MRLETSVSFFLFPLINFSLIVIERSVPQTKCPGNDFYLCTIIYLEACLGVFVFLAPAGLTGVDQHSCLFPALRRGGIIAGGRNADDFAPRGGRVLGIRWSEGSLLWAQALWRFAVRGARREGGPACRGKECRVDPRSERTSMELHRITDLEHDALIRVR